MNKQEMMDRQKRMSERWITGHMMYDGTNDQWMNRTANEWMEGTNKDGMDG